MQPIGFALVCNRGCNNGQIDQAHFDFLRQKCSAWRRNGMLTQNEHILSMSLAWKRQKCGSLASQYAYAQSVKDFSLIYFEGRA